MDPGRVRQLELGDPAWAAFVAQSADASPFHDPAWAAVLAETYGFAGFVLTVTDEASRTIAGAPFLELRGLSRRRRWTSLPFTDECPLLAEDQDAERLLLAGIAESAAASRVAAIEVRGTVDLPGWRSSADAVIHELMLDPDPERVRSRFSRSQVVRNIARAEREGVSVRRAAGPADLDAFYALHTRTRRRQGVPVQPRRFFELIWRRLVEPGRAFILLADGGHREAVAGALFLSAGSRTIYKFGASDVESWPLRPNHLIFWTAIKEACERGERCFDLGRTELSNSGLRAFKSSWGTAVRPLRYCTLAPGTGAADPGLATRALGVAIRRGPRWVCRGAGETLYRFAASR